jgi:hypothetical protein
VPVEFSVGEATTEPPEAAEYQLTPVVDESTVLASKVCIGNFSHSVIEDAVTAGGSGAGLMVKVTGVRVVLEQVPFEYSAK